MAAHNLNDQILARYAEFNDSSVRAAKAYVPQIGCPSMKDLARRSGNGRRAAA